jgi:hypothetical protein
LHNRLEANWAHLVLVIATIAPSEGQLGAFSFGYRNYRTI